MFLKSNDFVKFFNQMTIFAVLSLRQAQRPLWAANELRLSSSVTEPVEVTAWESLPKLKIMPPELFRKLLN